MLNELIILALVFFSSIESDQNWTKNKFESGFEDSLTIRTLNGPVRGVQLNYDSKYKQTYNVENVNYSIRAWLGIPYAQKPTGDLRFKRPVAVNNWTKVLKVKEYQKKCYQSRKFAASLDVSEDCLYLNIWAPLEASNSAVLVKK